MRSASRRPTTASVSRTFRSPDCRSRHLANQTQQPGGPGGTPSGPLGVYGPGRVCQGGVLHAEHHANERSKQRETVFAVGENGQPVSSLARPERKVVEVAHVAPLPEEVTGRCGIDSPPEPP